ncbi:hypothetical protein [Flavobacterium sp. WV_118_3]|uniref:hypothetical protein n=1 Tax=Flavobacterium sp. WV_118_3 TaxID=3151764 RepID=UPI0012CE349E|nr:hypothetical protein [Flavobacterium sp.]
MHHIPRYDFRIGYVKEADQGDYTKKLAKGIFTLLLNHFVDVRFIPHIENIDDVIDEYTYDDTTIQGVRMACLFASKYVVTPSDANEGKNRIISKAVIAKQYGVAIENIASEIIVFYVSVKTYKKYIREVRNIFYTDKYGDYTNVFYRQNAFMEDLKKEYKLAVFLENRIINSSYFSDDALAYLKRQRDKEGNVVPMED